MPPAPLPRDEDARLAELDRLGLPGSPPDPSLDAHVRLAATVCRTPMAAVSLIHAERQCLTAAVGLEVGETPRDQAFCAYTILEPGRVLVVTDAARDWRFHDNPLVTGPPGIRFYAGAALVSDRGHALGSLCVIDTEPRGLSAVAEARLRLLARDVARVLSPRRGAAGARGRGDVAPPAPAVDRDPLPPPYLDVECPSCAGDFALPVRPPSARWRCPSCGTGHRLGDVGFLAIPARRRGDRILQREWDVPVKLLKLLGG